MIVEGIKRIMQKNGLKVEKVILLPSNDVNAKYLKKYKSRIVLRLT